VVEDEPQIRKMLFRFLQAQGYTVSLATNGVEALEQVQKERPDLLLLDVNMPVMNGLEVLQQLKQQNKQLKVIMMSGTSTPEMIKSAMELGVMEFLDKPVTLKKLKESIARILVNSHSLEQSPGEFENTEVRNENF